MGAKHNSDTIIDEDSFEAFKLTRPMKCPPGVVEVLEKSKSLMISEVTSGHLYSKSSKSSQCGADREEDIGRRRLWDQW
jgi:hypothetical protein